jgi:hypothetical protein
MSKSLLIEFPVLLSLLQAISSSNSDGIDKKLVRDRVANNGHPVSVVFKLLLLKHIQVCKNLILIELCNDNRHGRVHDHFTFYGCVYSRG